MKRSFKRGKQLIAKLSGEFSQQSLASGEDGFGRFSSDTFLGWIRPRHHQHHEPQRFLKPYFGPELAKHDLS
jgi:hypothetical protein